jgi:uncharacterized protein YdiU (UPF0061 family)
MCHDAGIEILNSVQQLQSRMRRLGRDSNPALIPRNHQVEAVLEAAVKQGNYSVMEQLLRFFQASTLILLGRLMIPRYPRNQQVRTKPFAGFNNLLFMVY